MSTLASIIIPCRNAASWIEQTLESALTQDWRHIEIIVVDDGSTDRSAAIVGRFAHRGVKLASLQGRGAAAARNLGFSLSKGQFIQFLDADDLISPEKISAQLNLLSARPEGTIASCSWGRFTDDPSQAQFVDTDVFCDFDPLDFLLLAATSGAMMHPSAWLAPRAVLEAAGPWNEGLSLNDDGEYFCRVALRSPGIAYSNAGKSYYRSGLPMSLSRRRDVRALRSQYNSLELISAHIMDREDSPRVRRALADQWQRFVYDFYPDAPALISAAERSVRGYGGSRVPPPLGSREAFLARIIGWKGVRRLKRLLRS